MHSRGFWLTIVDQYQNASSCIGSILSLNGIGFLRLHKRYEELRIAYLALIGLMSFVLTRILDLYEPNGNVACGTNGMSVV
jgi:hypothetical protein